MVCAPFLLLCFVESSVFHGTLFGVLILRNLFDGTLSGLVSRETNLLLRFRSFLRGPLRKRQPHLGFMRQNSESPPKIEDPA